MSSDHEDKPFEAYQKLRAQAEQEIRQMVHDWAMKVAPDEMTVGQMKELSDHMARSINHHTRQVFNLVASKC